MAVKVEQKLETFEFVFEPLWAVTCIDGFVVCAMSVEQFLRHRQRVVKIGKGRAVKFCAGVEDGPGGLFDLVDQS